LGTREKGLRWGDLDRRTGWGCGQRGWVGPARLAAQRRPAQWRHVTSGQWRHVTSGQRRQVAGGRAAAFLVTWARIHKTRERTTRRMTRRIHFCG